MQYYVEKVLFFAALSAFASMLILFVERHIIKHEFPIIVKHIFTAVFILFILILSDMTIIHSRDVYDERMIDLVPFDNLVGIFNNESPREAELLLLNIISLTPFGVFFPLAFQKHSKLCIPVGILYGIIVECLQFILIRGVFEVDVIIYRTIGVGIGYIIYLVAAKLLKKHSINQAL